MHLAFLFIILLLFTIKCRNIWLARNIAINRYDYNSAAKHDRLLTVSLDEIADCVPATPDENISLSDLADSLSRFLRSQDDVHRRVFVRRCTYGDSLADIARRYSLNEKTVATYLFRTRNKLRESLKKEGYDYE